jgi:hypothetical protein
VSISEWSKLCRRDLFSFSCLIEQKKIPVMLVAFCDVVRLLAKNCSGGRYTTTTTTGQASAPVLAGPNVARCQKGKEKFTDFTSQGVIRSLQIKYASSSRFRVMKNNTILLRRCYEKGCHQAKKKLKEGSCEDRCPVVRTLRRRGRP